MMKTYRETVEHLGMQVWHSYMSGSLKYWDCVDLELVAFIYERNSDDVFDDVDAAFKKQIEISYDKTKEVGKEG